jgi:hypothetical protein
LKNKNDKLIETNNQLKEKDIIINNYQKEKQIEDEKIKNMKMILINYKMI